MEQLRIWKLRRWSNGEKKDWQQRFRVKLLSGCSDKCKKNSRKTLGGGAAGVGEYG